jgi:hypothetical protein
MADADADTNVEPGRKRAHDNDSEQAPDAQTMSIEFIWTEADALTLKQENGHSEPIGSNESEVGHEAVEEAEGCWSIAWGDSELEGLPSKPTPNALIHTPAQCPDCGGAGTILLLTSRRPCQRCGGTGSFKG